ncbi:MAG: cobalt-precorrin-5B (C(1))-methyltransferase [Chloroflexota bacterium]
MQTAANRGEWGASQRAEDLDLTADQVALQTVGLSYNYASSSRGLCEVDFAAARGQFVVLLGPNGSGKTTLLKTFVGLLRPTAGQVRVLGRELTGNDLSWVHRHLGFLWQDPNDQLFCTTVGEDVAFGPRNWGLAPPEVARRVEVSLETVGLTVFAARPIQALSFGEKRRTALAGILAMEPAVLVLDEPTAGLDPLRASQLLALLHRLSRQDGRTIVMATHDVDVVPAYADLVYVLRDGRVVAAGLPPVVFAQTRIIAESHMRLPRAAHALQVAGHELGLALVDLPFTIESYPSASDCDQRRRVQPQRAATTGAAAAAAARAAAELLVHGSAPSKVELRSSLGAILRVPVATCSLLEAEGACVALAEVVKVANDEGDPTNGARIQAWVRLDHRPGVRIEGGPGIGKVMSHGLPVQVGEPAINPVPRQMIVDAVADLVPAGHGLLITLSSPNGEELARLTANAAAGIQGGIAILGGPALADNDIDTKLRQAETGGAIAPAAGQAQEGA